MRYSWIRKLFATPTQPIHRSFHPHMLQLEARDVPASIVVDPTFNSGTPGWQVTAFNKVSDGFAAAGATDVTVNAGDYTTVDPVTANLTAAIPVTFVGATTLTALAATTGTMTVNGDVTFGNGVDTAINAVVSGTGGFIKQGSGKVTFSETNTYTGLTTVNAGVLVAAKAGAFGATGAGQNTVVTAGAAVEISGGVTVAEPITLAGDGISNGGALRSTSAGNIWSGAVGFAAGGARIHSDVTGFTLSGAVGVAGNIEPITFGGVGNMTVSGAINSGTAGTGTAGQLNFVGGNTVTIASINTATLTSPILISNNTVVSYATVAATHPLGTLGLVTLDAGTLQQTTPSFALNFISNTRNITLLAGGGTVEYTFGTTGNLNIIQNTAPGTTISGVGELRFKGPGTIALAQVATYTGPTHILSGGISRTRGTNFTFPIGQSIIVDAGGSFEYSSTGQQQQAISLEGAGQVNFTALTASRLTINNTVASPIPDKIFTGPIIGSGGFIMNGNGTQTLAGASTYLAVTTVTAGTLLAGNSTGSAFGTGALTVAAAGTVGSVATSTNGITNNSSNTINGSLAPGNVGTTGRLTMNNNVTFGSASAYKADLRSTALNGFGTVGFDQLVVNATTTITDGAKLLLDLTGYSPTPGDSWKILENNGNTITTRFRDAAGALLDQNTEFLIGADLYRISYTGGDGNDIVVTRALPASTYYVRKDFTNAAPDLDPGTAGVQVDGNPLDPLEPFATVGVNAFASISAAVTKSTVDGDKIIVSADAADATYAEQVNIAAKQIFFTFQENPITINSILGSNNGSSIVLGTKADLVTGVLLTLGIDDIDNLSLAASISGPGGIIKVGNGKLTLNPIANTYSGSTSVSSVAGGALIAGTTGAFSALSPYDLTATGRLILNGKSNSVGNLTGPVGSFVENANASGAILTAGSTKIADQSTNDLNFAGTLQDGVGGGSFGFVKVGSGVLTIPVLNDFTGPFGLLGGSYTVATLDNGGVAGPFGKSTNAATNFRFGGGATLVYTGPAVTSPAFDRNFTWFSGGATLDFASDVTASGSITPSGTPGTFIKQGLGKLAFTTLNAFQAPNSGTAYGNLSTGNITVGGGELIVPNLTLRGAVAARSPVNYTGVRTLTLTSPGSATIKNTLAFDPDASYVNQVSGTGTLFIDTGATATKTNPSIAFDTGPNVANIGGGDIRPLGSVITAPITLVGNDPVVIVGKANRNDLNRHSGDLRINSKITGSAPIQFVGLTSTDSLRVNSANASNVHFVLNADNSTTFTGAVSLANADLALGTALSLSAANSLTFNSVVDANTRNRATLFLFGDSVTIGSLNDTSAVGTTANIRNGAQDTAVGGTGSSTGTALGTQTDSTLTIVQTVDGTFNGDFSNGPNDNPESTAFNYKALLITKDGTAKLTVTGTSPVTATNLINPMAATITVSGGAMIFNGSIATASNVTTVTGLGTLGGSGSIKAALVQGTITGGTDGGAGKLTSGDLALFSTAVYKADLVGPGTVAGTDYDQLSVTGAVDLGGATLTINSAYSPTAGTPLVIIDNDTALDPVVGTFINVPNEGDILTAGGNQYKVSYVGGDGNDVTLTRQAAGGAAATGFTVNGGNAQRSRIVQIEVLFNGSVSAASFQTLGAITLTRTAVASVPTGNIGDIVQTGPTANNHITVTQGTGTSLILTFDNSGSFTTADIGVENGSLSDGYWQLGVGAFQSTPADLALRRLYGDSTVSAGGTVDGADNIAYGNAFNSSNVAFDFNNDGTVDGSDNTAFGNRFGRSL